MDNIMSSTGYDMCFAVCSLLKLLATNKVLVIYSRPACTAQCLYCNFKRKVGGRDNRHLIVLEKESNAYYSEKLPNLFKYVLTLSPSLKKFEERVLSNLEVNSFKFEKRVK